MKILNFDTFIIFEIAHIKKHLHQLNHQNKSNRLKFVCVCVETTSLFFNAAIAGSECDMLKCNTMNTRWICHITR